VPDDIGSPPGSGVAPRRLCIVSRDPLLSGVFVAALTTALGQRDELEIIVDRRRGGPPADQPSIERRHHPHVAHALERDGFAIVPTRVTQPAEHSIPAASPIERPALKDADERELERILEFKRQRKVRLSRWLILTGLMSVILVLLVLSPAVKTLMSRARPAAPPSADRMNASSIVAPVPQVARTPSPNPEVRPLPRAGRQESPETGRPSPSAFAPPPKGLAFKVPSPKVALPQVDVMRNPAPVSEGGGEAYAVRLSDTAGRPIAGAEVLLLIRMADGTLLDVPLEASAELGTYHVTIPSLQPAPVDLRVRVVTSDTRVEIPLTP